VNSKGMDKTQRGGPGGGKCRPAHVRRAGRAVREGGGRAYLAESNGITYVGME
jgi:hypothetical protein